MCLRRFCAFSGATTLFGHRLGGFPYSFNNPQGCYPTLATHFLTEPTLALRWVYCAEDPVRTAVAPGALAGVASHTNAGGLSAPLMKLLLTLIATGLAGVVLLPRGGPAPGGGSASKVVVPVRTMPSRSEIAGTVLTMPYQVVRTPVAGRVIQQYFSEGQTVKMGTVLLKLAVGSGPARRTIFASAPAAGDLTHTTTSAGQYVAAGTPYAHLTSRGAVRVRVASTDAAHLQPGDSVHVQQGPVGLIGKTTPLTTLLPDPAGATVVLVLGRLGWPPGTAVRVMLIPLRAQTGPILSAAK